MPKKSTHSVVPSSETWPSRFPAGASGLEVVEEAGIVLSAPGPDWAGSASSEHLVQFYEDEAFLIKSVSEFVAAGLGIGEKVVIIATGPHRAGIDQALIKAGLDPETARSRGNYLALDAASTLAGFMEGDLPDETRFNETVGALVARFCEGRTGVRAFGEMVALLCAEGNPAGAIRLEQLWNELGKRYSFSLLCGYNINTFSGAENRQSIVKICREHSHVFPTENYSAKASRQHRLREIALLQQEANSFSVELENRLQAERTLRETQIELERQVAELSRVRAALERELAERREMEESLRENDRRLRFFQENATVGLHWVDGEGMILWANAAELEMLGYAENEYVGHHISDFHADHSSIKDILGRLQRNEKLKNYEARLKCKDGSIKHVLIDSSVFWQNGRFVNTQCFTRDVTDKTRALQLLLAQYSVSRILSESATIEEAARPLLQAICNNREWDVAALWVGSAPGADLRCAELWHAPDLDVEPFAAATRTLTLAPGVGLLGRIWKTRMPVWIRDLGGDGNFVRRPMALQCGLSSAAAFPILIGDECFGVIECFSRVPRSRDGDFLELAESIGSQIGQFLGRKRIERMNQHFASMIEFSDDAIISKDLNGIVTSWNSGARRIFGYSEEEMVGKPIVLLIPEDRADEEPGILRRIRQGERVDHYETVRRRKDGSLVDISLTISPIRDSSGTIIGASKIARDISERKKAYKALQEAKEQLVEVNDGLEKRVQERTASLREAIAQMEEFSYTVSHDLRAPLRGMQSYGHALIEDFGSQLPPEALHYLNRLNQNAGRLDRMILDVLTFSRISRADLRLENVALEHLVNEMIQHYPAMQPPRADIQVGPLLPVHGHEPSLTQAVSNLLSNAVKFVGPGVIPCVRVWTEPRDGEVRLWVEDNGIGIEPKFQHRLFSMFERIHPNSKYEGTGVGLAIVRKAVERMGGSVGLESDGKHGSRFWIQLRAST